MVVGIIFTGTSYYLYQYTQSYTKERLQDKFTLFVDLRKMLQAPGVIDHQKRIATVNNIVRSSNILSLSKKPLYSKQIQWVSIKEHNLTSMLHFKKQLDESVSIYLTGMKQWLNIKERKQLSVVIMLLLMLLQLLLLLFLLYYLHISMRLIQPWIRLKKVSSKLLISPISDNKLKPGPKLVSESALMMERLIDKLQNNASERNLTLKALTHDLRTPLARLQLLSEDVEDKALEQEISEELVLMSDYLTGILNFTEQTFSEQAFTTFNVLILFEAVEGKYHKDARVVTNPQLDVLAKKIRG